MDIWLLTLVYMIKLYQLYIALYWISFFLLVYAYQVMIIVIWYSFNGLSIVNCSITNQSIYLFISNCSIELLYSQLVFTCLLLYVNCYNPIEAIAIQLQLKKTISLTVQLIRSRHPKVPPLQFFLQIRI